MVRAGNKQFDCLEEAEAYNPKLPLADRLGCNEALFVDGGTRTLVDSVPTAYQTFRTVRRHHFWKRDPATRGNLPRGS